MHLMSFGGLPLKISSIDVQVGVCGQQITHTSCILTCFYFSHFDKLTLFSVVTQKHQQVTSRLRQFYTSVAILLLHSTPTPDVYNVWFHRAHIMKRERVHYYSCCCEVLVWSG